MGFFFNFPIINCKVKSNKTYLWILSFKNWKVNKLSSKSIQTEKAKFSHFDGTRGDKNQIFRTLATFKFDASLDDCWAKSGYQDEIIVNQGFIFPKPYGDGICDEKLNIYECNFDGGDCCQAVTRDFRCYEEGCNCHLFGLPAPSIFGDTKYFSEK